MSALGAVLGELHRIEIWLPFTALAGIKAAVLVAVARFDLLPAICLAPMLALVPQLDRRLHYPAVPFGLPRLGQGLDIVLFLSFGALAQGWAIGRLARAWGVPAAPLERREAWTRRAALVGQGALLVVVPLVASRAVALVSGWDVAEKVGVVGGAAASVLLFVAPAFVAVHGMSLRSSLVASARMVSTLPFALPLAVLLVATPHVPGLLLDAPVVRAGAASNPDWILLALLGQLPAEVLGAVLASGLAAYFAVRTGMRRTPTWRPPAAVAMLLLVAFGSSGCGLHRAEGVQLRYEAERFIERARLRKLALDDQTTPADSLQWLEVARLYGSALDNLGTDRLRAAPQEPIDRDLERLACRALLGRAGANATAGRTESARRDYRLLLEPTIPFRGMRGDAMLGLADCEDDAHRWDDALAAYTSWMQGVRDATWPLHDDGVEVAAYVASRLRARGESAARAAWIDLAAAGLDAAAARNECAHEARTARFALLLSAERWTDAYDALRRLREEPDAEEAGGALLVAEASLLAGGLGRQRDAMGILDGLDAENSPFDAQHRIAGWLLLGQIQFRAARWDEAEHAYERAERDARSEAGKSEATLGLARVRAARGDLDAARRQYARLRELYASTPAGLVAPLEELRMLRDRGEKAEVRALLPVAMQTYRSVLQRYGAEMPAFVAAQCLSECMGQAGDWPQSVAFLDSIADAFGSDPHAGSLLVRAARLAAVHLDDPGRAEILLASLRARYPDSDAAVLARGFADSLGQSDRTP